MRKAAQAAQLAQTGMVASRLAPVKNTLEASGYSGKTRLLLPST